MVSTVPTSAVMAALTPEDRQRVTELRDQLCAMLGPRLRDLRLFGSKVRGDDHDESDIDVLVLLDTKDDQTTRAIIEAAHLISPWLSLVISEYERYHAPSSRATGFYKELRRDTVHGLC